MSGLGDESRPVRAGEELDVERLGEFLAERLPEPSGPLAVEQFPGGHSNLTYLLRLGDRELVLRRPPFGAKAIKSGHDMGREFRILSGLHPVFGKVPRPLLYCPEEESPIGATFYVMERVEGVILRAAPPAGLDVTPARMRSISDAFVDNLADLHAVDVRATGLDGIGRPEGYVRRQIDGWTERYSKARTDQIDAMERVAAWLGERTPRSGEAALIHNDYKYDNVVLDPASLERIVAVLDWEMATIGDPLADLGTTLAYWIVADDPDEMRALQFGATTLPGNPSRAEIVERYAARTGREPVDVAFYYVLALFKIAVIAQQIYYRYARGFTQDDRFARMIGAVHVLSLAALRASQRGAI